MTRGVKPEGERLRSAVRWLSGQEKLTRTVIDQAARRFDLSPLEEEFLYRELLRQPGSDKKPGGGFPE